MIERERARIAKRLKAHFSNNVWERRTAPPEDWNKPLPDHLADAAEDSLLRDHAPIKRIRPEDFKIQEEYQLDSCKHSGIKLIFTGINEQARLCVLSSDFSFHRVYRENHGEISTKYKLQSGIYSVATGCTIL